MTEKNNNSENWFRAIFENTVDCILIADVETRKFLDANNAACQIFGYSVEEFKNLEVDDIHPVEILSQVHEIFKKHLKGESYTDEDDILCKRKNGQVFYSNIKASLFDQNEKKCVIVFFRDNTEQNKINEQIRLQALVLDQISDNVTITDLDGNITYINKAQSDSMEYIKGDLVGKNVEIFGDDPERGATQKEILQKTLSDGFWRGEIVNQTLDGNEVIMDCRTQKIHDADNNPICLCGSATDITERKKLEKSLRLSEEKFKTLFTKMLNGFALHEIICDDQGKPIDYRFVEINSSFEHMTGLKAENVIGKTVLEIMPNTETHWIETYGKVALTGEAIFFETYAKELDKHFEVTAFCPSKNQFACIFADVTERKLAEKKRLLLERQVQHAQKLESLGVLAGGIAHDFNNLLMAIMGNAEMAMHNLSPMSSACENLHEIVNVSTRAAELAKQMLAYSGKGRFVIESINAGDIISEMVHLLEVSISKKIALKLNLGSDLPIFDGDTTQIRQVVMNMIINASEAIGEKSGVITLSTGVMDCDHSYLSDVNEVFSSGLKEPLSEGLYIYFEVADTGCGMTDETIEKIFDPFFTTKFTGRGLGMSATLGIVHGHNGALKIYSELEKGTTIKILFPASKSNANIFTSPKNDENSENEWHGSGTILIADDEKMLCTVGKQMLERMGFNVLTALDGVEALKIFRTHAAEIVCVLLDLTMPHMNGDEAFREMRRLKPGVKVILCSGYNEQDATQRFVGKGLAGFLHKPYNVGALRKKLRSVLTD